MTPQQIDLVIDTFAQLLKHRGDVGMIFYGRLFAFAPELRGLFKIDIQVQSRKLMDTLATAVASLHDTPALGESLARLGMRHRGYGVRPSHYVLVGEALISTLAIALGPRFDDAAREAWTTLYRDVTIAMLAPSAPQASSLPPAAPA